MFNKILVFNRCRRLAPATTTLGLIGIQRLGFGITLMGNGHHQILFVNQVCIRKIELTTNNIGTPLIAIGATHLFKLVAHNRRQALVGAENIQQVCDLIQHTLIIFHQFVLLHGGQAMQPYFQNRLGLLFRQTIKAIDEAKVFGQSLGATSITAHTLQQFKQRTGFPAPLH